MSVPEENMPLSHHYIEGILAEKKYAQDMVIKLEAILKEQDKELYYTKSALTALTERLINVEKHLEGILSLLSALTRNTNAGIQRLQQHFGIINNNTDFVTPPNSPEQPSSMPMSTTSTPPKPQFPPLPVSAAFSSFRQHSDSLSMIADKASEIIAHGLNIEKMREDVLREGKIDNEFETPPKGKRSKTTPLPPVRGSHNPRG